MTVESNLFLMLAVRAYYGYTLYRDGLATELAQPIEAWDAMMKGRMGWIDYSTCVGMDVPMGTPYPPRKPILKRLFPQIHRQQWKAVYWGSTYGVQGWAACTTTSSRSSCGTPKRTWTHSRRNGCCEPMASAGR